MQNLPKNLEQKRALYAEKIAEMDTSTTAGKKRQKLAQKHLANCENDSGAFGRIEELLSHSHGSKISIVRKQGWADTYVKINGRRYGAEVKTNGGRLGDLIDSPREFVVYSLNICNSNTGYKPRILEQILLRKETFLQVLEDCNAIKSTNGDRPEPAIQCTSLKMFKTFEILGVPYDAERDYAPEEIN